MENRIAKLEEFAADAKIRLTRIEAVLDQNGSRLDQNTTQLDQNTTRLDQTAKELNDLRVDMHKGFADMTKWIVGTALGMSAAGIVVMTFVLNNATPKSPAAVPTSIVVYAQQPGPTAAANPTVVTPTPPAPVTR